MIKLRDLKILLTSYRFIVATVKQEFGISLAFTVVFAILPFINLLIGKAVIDLISRPVLSGQSLSLSDVPGLKLLVFGFILLNLFTASAGTLTNSHDNKLRDRMYWNLQSLILRKISNTSGVSLFEDGTRLNTIQSAKRGIDRALNSVSYLTEFLSSFIALAVASVLLFNLSPWIPVWIFLLVFPAIYVKQKADQASFNAEMNQAADYREINIYNSILTEQAYAKELRLLSLQAYFHSLWSERVEKVFGEINVIRNRGALKVILFGIPSTVGLSIPYIYLLDQTLKGQISLGSVALFTGLLWDLRRNMMNTLNRYTSIQEMARYIQPILAVADFEDGLTSSQSNCPDQHDVPNRSAERSGLKLTNVSFSYGSSERAIGPFNLHIEPGEFVVIVGENGAGKSTLAKLISRLYEPQHGRILWNGQDIRSMPANDYYHLLNVVPQDFARFPLPMREVIALGKLSLKDEDGQKVMESLTGVGLAPFVATLPARHNTRLSTQFDNGIDLSGGQWQRMSIARALYRQTPDQLLVLDEPTAALDPSTEHEMLTLLRTLARGSTAIVISHRLSLAKAADRILVIDHGKIVEDGSHAALIQQDGKYADMYRKQSSYYTE